MREIGAFCIPPDHPSLEGHFPGRPIVPGVILLDEALAAVTATDGLAPPLRLERVKFMAPVTPGERVTVLAAPPEDGALRLACLAGKRSVLQATVRYGIAAPTAPP